MTRHGITFGLALATLAVCCHLVLSESSEDESAPAPTDVTGLVNQIEECMAPVWEKMSQATLREQANIIGSLFAYARDLVLSPKATSESDSSQDSSHFFYLDEDFSRSWSAPSESDSAEAASALL